MGTRLISVTVGMLGELHRRWNVNLPWMLRVRGKMIPMVIVSFYFWCKVFCVLRVGKCVLITVATVEMFWVILKVNLFLDRSRNFEQEYKFQNKTENLL